MKDYKNLRILTTYVTPERLQMIIDDEYLPIFIARTITNSGLIGKWQGSSVHFSQLAPSPTLLRDWKKNRIDDKEFEEKFRQEQEKVDYEAVLKRLALLCDCSNAKGVILFGYGQDPRQCHRSIVSKLINETGLLNNPVEEI